MSLTHVDVLVPTGEIEGVVFYPQLLSVDVNTRLDAYLANGYALASSGYTLAQITPTQLQLDEIARAYTYFRALNDVVIRMTSSPASASLGGEVSTSFLQTQINEWITQRDNAKTAYIGLIPPAFGLSTAATPGVSQSIPTEFTF